MFMPNGTNSPCSGGEYMAGMTFDATTGNYSCTRASPLSSPPNCTNCVYMPGTSSAQHAACNPGGPPYRVMAWSRLNGFGSIAETTCGYAPQTNPQLNQCDRDCVTPP
jgi:hypothetical protein